MAPQTNGKFWMVYAQGNHGPISQHLTLESAREGAIRLAQVGIGVVYILEAIESASLEKNPPTKLQKLMKRAGEPKGKPYDGA